MKYELSERVKMEKVVELEDVLAWFIVDMLAIVVALWIYTYMLEPITDGIILCFRPKKRKSKDGQKEAAKDQGAIPQT